MDIIHTFSIAGWTFKTISERQDGDILKLLPSFLPFQTEPSEKEPLFLLTIDDDLQPIPSACCEHIRAFDSGNGYIIVDRLHNGGYQYLIKDLEGHPCCLLLTNKDFTNNKCALYGGIKGRAFGLNDALMLCFAFAGSKKKTLLIHASVVRNEGYGYAFIAKSGTGKSTHTALWLKHIKGCDLMNDDNPVVRIIEGQPYIFGSPWSGKTPCYRNVKARLGAITHIERAKTDEIRKLAPVKAFTAVLPSCSTMKWDKDIYDSICDTITSILQTTGIYQLRCLPDEEAARMAYHTLRRI